MQPYEIGVEASKAPRLGVETLKSFAWSPIRRLIGLFAARKLCMALQKRVTCRSSRCSWRNCMLMSMRNKTDSLDVLPPQLRERGTQTCSSISSDKACNSQKVAKKHWSWQSLKVEPKQSEYCLKMLVWTPITRPICSTPSWEQRHMRDILTC